MRANLLATLIFAASPALAEDVICGDVAFVTPESIAFVANFKGKETPPPPRTDIKAALEAEGGMIWITSGPEPSEAVQSCLALAEQRVPGVTELLESLLDEIGKPISPETLEALLLPFPEEERPALLASGFGDLITGGHGRRLEAGPWASFVQVIPEEPHRSLQTIELWLGPGRVHCFAEQACFDAFTDFIAE